MSFTHSSQAFSSSMGDLDIFESLDAARAMFENFPVNLPTLDEALRAANVQNYDLVSKDSIEFAATALRNKDVNSLGLSCEEAAAISCYTLQLKGAKSPFEVINEGLAGSRNRSTLLSTRRLIFLFLSGLRKLPRFAPPVGQQLFRGIKKKVPVKESEANGHQFYAKGRIVTWWGFTSTTTDFDATNGFISGAAESTLFNIGGPDLWGYSIQAFSPFKKETEVLLEPEAKVKVNGVVPFGSNFVAHVELQPFTHLVLEDIIPPVGHILQIPQPPTGLPAGWEARYDPKSRRFYYADTVDKITTWQQPPYNVALPAGWRVAFDQQRNDFFYRNTTLTAPTSVPGSFIAQTGSASMIVQQQVKVSQKPAQQWTPTQIQPQWSMISVQQTQVSQEKRWDCLWKKCPNYVVYGGKLYFVDEKNPRIVTKSIYSNNKECSWGYCTVIGNTALPHNKVTSWNIKILKSKFNNGHNSYIGVAPSDINQNEGYNKCGWYFHCYDSTLYSGPPHSYGNIFSGKEYGPRKGDGKYVHIGDSVGVVMDTTKGELSFVVNDATLGVAYKGIPLDKPLVPCVLLSWRGDSVELIV